MREIKTKGMCMACYMRERRAAKKDGYGRRQNGETLEILLSTRDERLHDRLKQNIDRSDSHGCHVWDEQGRRYTDTIMALGAVALGYGHPAVTAAVERAVRDGGVGSLAPVHEAQVAGRLIDLLTGVEAVRFFKTGAEAGQKAPGP